jgi:hypothetical protein
MINPNLPRKRIVKVYRTVTTVFTMEADTQDDFEAGEIGIGTVMAQNMQSDKRTTLDNVEIMSESRVLDYTTTDEDFLDQIEEHIEKARWKKRKNK